MNDPLTALDLSRRRFLGSLSLAAGASGVLGAMSPALYAQNTPTSGAAFQPPQKPPLANVEGKTAYVTGASSGIGLGIARACYDAGMNVIIGYIDERQVDEALSFFADRSRVMAIKHDVTDRPGWDRLVVEAEKRFRRVHLLVNNAGVGLFATVSKGSFNDFDWGMAVNVTGVFNGIHTFVPRMLEYGEGAHIATTSSMSGVLPGATAGIYTTSKFATCGMMEALRVELQATNIGTSVFLPGGVNTNIRDTERNRPEQFRNPSGGAQPPRPATPPPAAAAAAPPAAQRSDSGQSGGMSAAMDPLEAGRSVLHGVRRNDLFIFSHPEFKEGTRERFEAVMASFPVGRGVPQERLAIQRVTIRVPLNAAETARLQANPVGPLPKA
jgi:NAD(P)-dependent dehydrogenase (short-subunit alcohol dehydrogenase family)